VIHINSHAVSLFKMKQKNSKTCCTNTWNTNFVLSLLESFEILMRTKKFQLSCIIRKWNISKLRKVHFWIERKRYCKALNTFRNFQFSNNLTLQFHSPLFISLKNMKCWKFRKNRSSLTGPFMSIPVIETFNFGVIHLIASNWLSYTNSKKGQNFQTLWKNLPKKDINPQTNFQKTQIKRTISI